jgi:hypothetical protein
VAATVPGAFYFCVQFAAWPGCLLVTVGLERARDQELRPTPSLSLESQRSHGMRLLVPPTPRNSLPSHAGSACVMPHSQLHSEHLPHPSTRPSLLSSAPRVQEEWALRTRSTARGWRRTWWAWTTALAPRVSLAVEDIGAGKSTFQHAEQPGPDGLAALGAHGAGGIVVQVQLRGGRGKPPADAGGLLQRAGHRGLSAAAGARARARPAWLLARPPLRAPLPPAGQAAAAPRCPRQRRAAGSRVGLEVGEGPWRPSVSYTPSMGVWGVAGCAAGADLEGPARGCGFFVGSICVSVALFNQLVQYHGWGDVGVSEGVGVCWTWAGRPGAGRDAGRGAGDCRALHPQC